MKFKTIFSIFLLLVAFNFQNCGASKKIKNPESVEEAEAQAANILKETALRAETIRKEKQLEAKEHFVQLKSDYDRDLLEKNKITGANKIVGFSALKSAFLSTNLVVSTSLF